MRAARSQASTSCTGDASSGVAGACPTVPSAEKKAVVAGPKCPPDTRTHRLSYVTPSTKICGVDTPDFGKLIGSLVRHHFRACYRCGRECAANQADATDWAIRHILMYPVGLLCPDCQSPEDRAESTIREDTSTYTFERGRFVQHPQPDDDEDGSRIKAS